MQIHVSAGPEDQARILDTFTLAFCSDPPVRWMYPEAAQYYRYFREFAALFGGRAFDTGNAHHTSDYAGAALWLPPGTQPDEEALVSMLQQTVREQEKATIFAYFDEMSKYHPTEPHWHLTVIGVDPARQGQGHGSALLEHGLTACDQDEVTRSIVASLPARLEDAALERTRRKTVGSLTAYEDVLKAEWLWHRDAPPEQVLPLLNKAIESNASCARAYARAAQVNAYLQFQQPTRSEELIRTALDYAGRAVALGDGDARILALASTAYLLCGRHDLADLHSEKAVFINANDAEALFRRGVVVTYGGDPARGLDWMHQALRLDPLMRSGYQELMFDAYYMAKEYNNAIEVYRHWPSPLPHQLLPVAVCYAQLGNQEQVNALKAEINEKGPSDFDVSSYIRNHLSICRRAEDRDHWLEGYRKAGFIS